jgi:hypothetical protein
MRISAAPDGRLARHACTPAGGGDVERPQAAVT